MKFSMIGIENGDLLIQVTACAGLTVYIFFWKCSIDFYYVYYWSYPTAHTFIIIY